MPKELYSLKGKVQNMSIFSCGKHSKNPKKNVATLTGYGSKGTVR